jgi:hypothetical protein
VKKVRVVLLLSLCVSAYAMDEMKTRDTKEQDVVSRIEFWQGRIHISRTGKFVTSSYFAPKEMGESAISQLEDDAATLERIMMKETGRRAWSILVQFTRDGSFLTKSYTVPSGMEEQARLALGGATSREAWLLDKLSSSVKSTWRVRSFLIPQAKL